MRSRVFRLLPALLPLSALVAQEPISSPPAGVSFAGETFRHDVLLRDGEAELIASPSRGSFALPPGGRELELEPTSSTPYDRYFGSVRAVIAAMEPRGTNMAMTCHLMKVGHSFEYLSRDPYRPDPPKLTEVQHSGDCKSKALWLYENLADSGALFVIGKAEKYLRTSHAWVYWRSEDAGGFWIARIAPTRSRRTAFRRTDTFPITRSENWAPTAIPPPARTRWGPTTWPQIR